VTVDELIDFETDIAREFEAGRIHAPVHLSGGNELQLIEIFRDIRPNDWVLSTWRSHYHALLKGIPATEVKAQIISGRSMFISSVEHRFMSSAIMGGMLPIACGLGYSGERVWCFVGDMCESIGAFHDAVKFADGYGLDIRFVVEDNGLSTNTPTKAAWRYGRVRETRVTRYTYTRRWPHYQPLPGQHGF
jgi:pyruvate dehydrogenase E1 component alpha subunit